MSAQFGIHVSGKSDGGPIFVFTHGWPDDETLWNGLASRLESLGLCVRLTLPNFGDQPAPKAGFNLRELAEGMREAVKQVAPGKKVVLIGHDWGAHLSYIFEKNWTESVEAMITIDVGPRLSPRSLGHALFLAGYQWWLIDSWALGKVVPALGTAASQFLAKVLGAPHPERIRSDMNYPYIYIWRDLLRTSKRPESLAHYSPTVPVLFMYGGKKPYMFHTKEFCRELEAKPHSKVLEFPKAGHWLMLQEPERTANAIIDWLAAAAPQS